MISSVTTGGRDPSTSVTPPGSPEPELVPAPAPIRSIMGGTLMGLANLVPGVSGGTMLLAAGVYPQFIEAVAGLSRLKLRRSYIITLACVVGAAGISILAFAGPTKDLVVNHRWVMYSLFIGLTLGGIPIVWRLARPSSPALTVGAVVGLAVMLATALLSPAGTGGGSNSLLLGTVGLLGAAAMILPGISGGYMLLLLGQYVPILSAISDFAGALTADGGPDIALAVSAGLTLLPVGIGVALGVLVISNAIQWALARYKKATLGFLLGLLLGAVVGLWPFQRSVEPAIGSVLKGRVVSAENRAEFDVDDWPLEKFSPTGAQLGVSLLLVVLGFGATMLIGRIGAAQGREA